MITGGTTTSAFFAGLDLGKQRDFSAFGVVERRGDTRSGVCHVVHLERFPLGTPYPAVIDAVAGKMARGPLGMRLLVDATGVGAAVVDSLLAHPSLLPISSRIHACTTTGGNRCARVGQHWKTPKAHLVGALQILLQGQRLKVAKGLLQAELLLGELQSFRLRIGKRGHIAYGEWRAGRHDDLLFAVMLAAWGATHRIIGQT